MGKLTGKTRILLIAASLALLAGCNTVDSVMPSMPKMPDTASWSCARPGEKSKLVAELYMGLALPGGAYVNEFDWQQFLVDTVTPRFPEGLTVVDAYGQWLNKSANALTRENSKVLVIVTDKGQETEGKLDQIVRAYKSRFGQKSVMLVEQEGCVDFM